tara:strand:+ start:170 stop:430 length:261 start_codon:yes stop_codon:yes gene_type:complete
MFGISIEEITLLFTILMFIALVVNAMIISRALEMLMEMYEETSGLAAMERALAGIVEWRKNVKEEIEQEDAELFEDIADAWEDDWR